MSNERISLTPQALDSFYLGLAHVVSFAWVRDRLRSGRSISRDELQPEELNGIVQVIMSQSTPISDDEIRILGQMVTQTGTRTRTQIETGNQTEIIQSNQLTDLIGRTPSDMYFDTLYQFTALIPVVLAVYGCIYLFNEFREARVDAETQTEAIDTNQMLSILEPAIAKYGYDLVNTWKCYMRALLMNTFPIPPLETSKSETSSFSLKGEQGSWR